MRLQQYSGPVMAKGLEDTAFYRYNRFIALNEVGGDPDRFGTTVAAFHKANQRSARSTGRTRCSPPRRTTPSAAKMPARAWLPIGTAEEWAQQLPVWTRILRAGRGDIEGTAPRPQRRVPALSAAGRLLAARTENGQLGGEPLHIYAERIKQAVVKSMREAKVHSTWAAPNQAYEDAVVAFVEAALNAGQSNAFLGAFLPFAERIAALGMRNSLTQLTLKLTVPGVPDIYQGADLWDFNLVDPDNRRPVNYAARIGFLDEIMNDCGRDRAGTMRRLLENWRDGGIKLAITASLLQFRRQHEKLFTRGAYEPVPAAGAEAERICAFLRRYEDAVLLVAVSRFPGRSQMGWSDTVIKLPEDLQARKWRDVLTGTILEPGENAPAAERLFADLPVAVFEAA